MGINLKSGLVAGCLGWALVGAGAAQALTFDDNVTNNVIFGTGGNANGGWTIDRALDADEGIAVELGLRAKVRYSIPGDLAQNVFNSQGNGTYVHAVGHPASKVNQARWNFEWSVNSNYDGSGDTLETLTYVIGIDQDPSAGINFFVFDLFNNPDHVDHSLGDNGTGPSAGTEYANLGDLQSNLFQYNLAQNSWNMDFFDSGSGDISFNPDIGGTYSFYLAAYDGDNRQIARTDITVLVPVPEPTTVALLGAGLLGLAVATRRRAA